MTFVAASRSAASGVVLFYNVNNGEYAYHSTVLAGVLVETVELTFLPQSSTVLLTVGAAAPRNNKIHVFSLTVLGNGAAPPTLAPAFTAVGGLAGHQDWVRCLAFSSPLAAKPGNEEGTSPGVFLASGSHDHKIRLWFFHTDAGAGANVVEGEGGDQPGADEDEGAEAADQRDDELDVDALLQDQARLVLRTTNDYTIPVTLEALLIGHEESVSSVAWLPDSERPCLLSSSMDRTLLIWVSDEAVNGMWSPTVRVGAAGGIIGGR
jgi:elongator complex protein 2